MQSHDGDMVLIKAIDDDHVVRVSGDYGGLKCDLFIYESVDLGFAAIPWLIKDLGRCVGNVPWGLVGELFCIRILAPLDQVRYPIQFVGLPVAVSCKLRNVTEISEVDWIIKFHDEAVEKAEHVAQSGVVGIRDPTEHIELGGRIQKKAATRFLLLCRLIVDNNVI